MELELIRIYYPNGTNGQVFCQGRLLVYTIELPWKDNHTGVSCIPEGKYLLQKRYSPRLDWHIWIKDVPSREDILIHPANNALKELHGCIAPVSKITGIGEGAESRLAFGKMKALLYPAFDRKEPVSLTVKSKTV